MGGGPGGLGAAALVDGHVHDDRAWPHDLHHLPGDQPGRPGAWQQHGPDHQIGGEHGLGQSRGAGVQGSQRRTEAGGQRFKHGHIAIQHGHVGAEPQGHLHRVGADHPAADHRDRSRGHTGHPAQQHSPAARGCLQAAGAGLDGQAARYLGHGGEQGESALAVGDRLVGDGRDSAADQVVGLVGVGGEVQVGEQRVVGSQAGALRRLRFLDLHDQFGDLEELLGSGHHEGPAVLVLVVVEPGARARARFDIDLVTAVSDLAHAVGGEPDAALLTLDLLGHPNAHVGPLHLRLMKYYTRIQDIF